MSLELPYGGKRTTAGPWDEYYGPYASVAAAKAAIPEAVRYDGLTVQITGTGEYHWLQADLSDTGLVAKTSGSSGWPLTGTASLTGDVNVNGNGTAGFQMGVTGTQPVDIKLWASNQVELFGQALAYITSFGTARIQADDNGGTVVHLELSNAGTGSLHATDGVNESEIIVSPSGITLVLGSDATGDQYHRNASGYLVRRGTVSAASTSSLTIDSDITYQYSLTALAAALSIEAPTGTPFNGQDLLIRILDNGTARALTWNAIFRVIGVTLPTTTVISKTMYIACIYNSTDTKWDVIGVREQA